MTKTEKTQGEGSERIAKYLARAGICSRRDAEKLIAQGEVSVDGVTLAQPGVKVTGRERILVRGKVVATPQRPRLWRFYKPRGLVVSHKDEQGRDTVFDWLKTIGLPRVVSIGRLDLNSEGLLLLTNDGALARRLELPSNGWVRRYRVRVAGQLDVGRLQALSQGIAIDGVRYGPIEVEIDRSGGLNSWLYVSLAEGKNREIRRVMEHLNLSVNRLVRVSYGPFDIGRLEPGAALPVAQPQVDALIEGREIVVEPPRPKAAARPRRAEAGPVKPASPRKAEAAKPARGPRKPATGKGPARPPAKAGSDHAHRRRP